MRELSGKWRYLGVDVFEGTDNLGVDNVVFNRPTFSMLEIRRIKLWILDVVRDGLAFCVDLYLTKLGLPLYDLANEILIRVANDVTILKIIII